ncbi:glycosyltransferase [Mycobacterium sp. ITM-2016-00317]|uniref:glycosyltransferase n=1 Tax=Mycobacterium sp. ITM-2016-00317 TaxID=2099694 RepID=UPI00287F8220|nr:glycosyltransferase [Mycobacterium sp. ITM-2016-00317]WNG87508.1 glycosyltransferase [Mycobacterium sp. ITM-2016-00317]
MKRPLRIALIASCRYPISQPFAGGLEAHVWHLARALAEHGHQVALFAATGSDPALGCASLDVHHLEVSHAARSDASMPADSFMKDHHAYLSLMLRLAGPDADRFDVIHNHSLHYLPVAMAPTLSTPMLTTVHTPPTPWLESAIKAGGGRGTRFAAVSEHTAAAWAPVGGPFTVVPNGIDARQWPLGPGGDRAVWFGRITPEKGPHLAIEAARMAGRALTLAGPISDPVYFADFIAPQLDDTVRYAGHLTQQRLAGLVGAASVALVTPTWDEPYGLVVAEAMSCGTPVVAFARGGIPELVAPEAGCLVPAGDVAALAAAIPVAAGLPRGRVHEHAVRQCSAAAMLRAYLHLYRQMISARSDDTDDRLLHPPSRVRPSRPGRQHRLTPAPAGDGIDVSLRAATTSVLRGRHTSS